MATNPPDGDFVVAHSWTSTGDLEPMSVTYGIHGNSPGNTADTVATEIDALWIIAGLSDPASFHVNWQYIGFTVTEYTAEGTIVAERPSAVSGTKAGTTLPPNCAMLFHKRTLSGGRRNRGRCFLPAAYLGEALVDNNGIIDNQTRLDRQTAWEAYRVAIFENDLIMVVHHESAPFIGTPVAAIVFDSKIATQRRRLR